jgi:hypothetical protein
MNQLGRGNRTLALVGREQTRSTRKARCGGVLPRHFTRRAGLAYSRGAHWIFYTTLKGNNDDGT